MSSDRLLRHSVEVLLAGQDPGGAFVASPSFPTYAYSWLRDGAFCAVALDTVGEQDAAAAFHGWVARSLDGQRERAERLLSRLAAGDPPAAAEMLPARLTLDGGLEPDGDEPWPNFQLDGYGMWLWSLERHVEAGGALDGAGPAAELVARYLAASWRIPCFNCWEEFDGGEHASTLGAVAAGLASASRLLGDRAFDRASAEVRGALLSRFVRDGRLSRGAADARLDGSLLWLAVPFGVLALDDPLVAATVEGVRRELIGPGGGVRRYVGDTYYGGGDWILLSCSLGWHDAVAGNGEGHEQAQGWVRAQARANGDLPEQAIDAPQAPDRVAEWEQRWGPVATPLLWSHAMYLLMEGPTWSSSP